jgi:hypothetical protein
MRSTGINDDDFNVQNVLRDAIINPASLEQRVNNLRIRSQALAQAADRTLASWQIWILAPPAPVQSRQPNPASQLRSSCTGTCSTSARIGAQFTPIRLPPGQGMYAQAYRQERARREDILDRQRARLPRAQADRIANLEAELERLRGQRANADQAADLNLMTYRASMTTMSVSATIV